jgi:hypothetical protein
MELQLLALDAVALLRAGAGEPGGGVEVEQDHQVRQEPAGRPLVDPLDRVAA